MQYYKHHHISSFVKGMHYPKEGFHTIDDPTFLGFTLMFDFYESKLFKGHQYVDEDGKVINETELLKETCAFAYLYNIGEYERIKYLKSFITNLEYINKNKGYYWQEIEGLDALWEGYNDFKGLPVASVWEYGIKTLESVDMKIFGLMELFRKAAYDYDHSKTVLPSNLQRFNMTVYVSEIRKFHPYGGISFQNNSKPKNQSKFEEFRSKVNDVLNPENLFKKNQYEPNTDYLLTDDIAQDVNGIIIDFVGCKFKPMSGGDIFNNVSNNAVEQASNSIKFEAKSASITSSIPWFEHKIENNPIDTDLNDETRWEKIQRRAKGVLESLARDAYRKALNYAKTSVTNLIKDNIPGGLIGTVQELQRGNVINALYNVVGTRNLGKVYSDDLNTTASTVIKNLGDVYPDIDGPLTNRRNNELGEVYPNLQAELNNDGENINDLGSVYPDLQNDLILQRRRENENLGEVYTEDELRRDDGELDGNVKVYDVPEGENNNINPEIKVYSEDDFRGDGVLEDNVVVYSENEFVDDFDATSLENNPVQVYTEEELEGVNNTLPPDTKIYSSQELAEVNEDDVVPPGTRVYSEEEIESEDNKISPPIKVYSEEEFEGDGELDEDIRVYKEQDIKNNPPDTENIT